MTHSADTSELILLPSLKAQRGPRGGLVLTQKFLNGVAQYARTWPGGRVTTLVQLRTDPTSDMDHVEVMPSEAVTPLELRPSSNDALAERLQNAAAVLGFLSPHEEGLAEVCRSVGVPLIYTSEYSPRTENQIIDATFRNPLRRWRRKLWVATAERIRRRELRLAAGIQCSGSPTFDIYRHINPNAMVFFDNRVPRAGVISESDLSRKLEDLGGGRPLRLVFGGRLIGMKGALELPRVARELKRLGIAFTLDIYGKGELEDRIKRDIAEFGLEQQVSLRGVLDFDKGWIPLLKERADVFVCCHPQGDPSSTYPEVMSCGVPIAGYDNEAFVGIVQHSSAGWLSPMNQPAKLATVIARLDRNRSELQSAARKAREFAAAHTFEKTFAARINHLVNASRLPERAKVAHAAAYAQRCTQAATESIQQSGLQTMQAN
jgi:glycosyltransferase involved in cell wall biosynthesis